ncbi:hypothetical protein HDU93_005195 [Gonapodya sp. JEL0774]|nr:hypothetical protein HDU93_005195 [Gonapodya sp. JEL0774]
MNPASAPIDIPRFFGKVQARGGRYIGTSNPSPSDLNHLTTDTVELGISKLEELSAAQAILTLFASLSPKSKVALASVIAADKDVSGWRLVSGISETSLGGLPDELLLLVFSKLDAMSIASSSRVCRRFHKVISDNWLWLEMCRTTWWGPLTRVVPRPSQQSSGFPPYPSPSPSMFLLGIPKSLENGLPATWSSIRQRRHAASLLLDSLARRTETSEPKGPIAFSDTAPTSTTTLYSPSPRSPSRPLSFILGLEPHWKTVFRSRHLTLANWRRGEHRVRPGSPSLSPPPPLPPNTPAPYTPLALGPNSLLLSIRTPFVPPDPLEINSIWSSPAVVWRADSGAVVGALPHSGGVLTAAAFDDASCLSVFKERIALAATFSTSQQPALFVAELSPSMRLGPPRRLSAAPSQPIAIKLDTEAGYMLVGCSGGHLLAYPVDVNHEVLSDLAEEVGRRSGAILCVAIAKAIPSADDVLVAAAGEEHGVAVWRKQSRTEWGGEDSEIFSLEETSPLNGGKPWRKVIEARGIEGHVYAIQLAAPYIITASSDQLIRIHSLSTGSTLSTFSHSSPATCLHALPFPGHADLLGVSGGADGRVSCWKVVDGNIELMWTRKAHGAPVWSVRVSGATMVTAALDRSVIVWDFNED